MELTQERRLTAVVARRDNPLKSLDDFKNHLAELFERFESWEWPPIPVWEKYVRGALSVVIKFQVASGRNIRNTHAFLASGNKDVPRHLCKEGSVLAVHHKIGVAGGSEADIEGGVLVSIVEHIKGIEHVSLSVWEDFKLDKSLFHPITGTYYSFTTGFKINPVIARGEFEVLILRSAIKSDHFPSEVVERTTEVVDSIAYYEGEHLGRVFGESDLDLNPPGMTVVMDGKSVRLSRDELGKFGLKVADVMIGPFDL